MSAFERYDCSNRKITFGVDSGACVAVVPEHCMATRGYIRHLDERTGGRYKTAGRQ